ncbi:MAG: endonuclease/exonuclease/phosphatase family protein [Spirochaetaceae bacterium]
MKKVIKSLLFILLFFVLVLLGLLIWLTITDYKPNNTQQVNIENNSTHNLPDEFTIINWNIGYGALGNSADFFMDGGVDVITPEIEYQKFKTGILEFIANSSGDFYFFQEVDIKSKRSYYDNQHKLISSILKNYGRLFATNYKVSYIPPPRVFKPGYGAVNAGLSTFSRYNIDSSERIALPGNYSWPTSILFLDRCMLISRIKTSTNKDLVLINTHNSAYDKGGFIKKEQLKFIQDYATKEYNLGNFVIIGGDWNTYMPGTDADSFPAKEKASIYYQPLPDEWSIDGWFWGVDKSVSTSRSLKEPYIKGKVFECIIDGFLVSPNIKIKEIKTFDLGYKYSDHNPIRISLELN